MSRAHFADLVARYVDLSPLRGRQRGKVLCPFHQEKTPSFSVDLEREVFHCFGCGAKGGRAKFAERVGAISEGMGVAKGSRRSRPERSFIDEAHDIALSLAQTQAWARPGMLELYRGSDWVRAQWHLIDRARRAATAAGPSARAWRVLRLAAEREQSVRQVETLLDELAGLLRTAS